MVHTWPHLPLIFQPLILTKYLTLSLTSEGAAFISFIFTLKHKHAHIHYSLPLSFHSLIGAHLIATSTIFSNKVYQKTP